MADGKRAPLDAWWVRNRKEIIKEVQKLATLLRPKLAQVITTLKSAKASVDPVVDAALEAVASSPEVFAKLNRLGDTFQLFLEERPLELRFLLSGETTPALFTNELVGRATNRDPESTRQRISHLRFRPRSNPR